MKKGFTLVELMAVIILLSIVAVIAVPAVLNLVSDSRNKLGEEQKLAIENAARGWGLKNLSEADGVVYYNDSPYSFISVETLQDSGMLESKTLEGFKINSSSGVCVSYNSNQFIYVYASSKDDC